MKEKLKLPILTLVLTLCVGLAQAQQSGNALVLLMNSGKTYTVYLADKPEVSFENTNLVIDSSTMYICVPLSTVTSFSFLDPAGIKKVLLDDQLKIIRSSNSVVISPLTDTCNPIRVFDMGGRLVNADIIVSGNTATVSLESLGSGVYVIKIGNQQTIKVTKK